MEAHRGILELILLMLSVITDRRRQKALVEPSGDRGKVIWSLLLVFTGISWNKLPYIIIRRDL